MSGAREGGYRAKPEGGPQVRSDIIEVFVYRSPSKDSRVIELLLLERASQPLESSWQPVMGHVERGETAVRTAVRELREEIGLNVRADDCLGFWALEQVHPYYVAPIDSIVLSPRFVVRVAPGWEPELNEEHHDRRWLAIDVSDPIPALAQLMWPGQKLAVREMLMEIVAPGAPAQERSAIDLTLIDDSIRPQRRRREEPGGAPS